MNIEKDKIDDNTYQKYLDQLNIYYKLKKKYDIQHKSYIKKLIDTKNSTEINKKLLSKHKIKCVNCGKDGGTIFKETNQILKAICGNTTNPCNLNIEIIKFKTIYLDKELENISKKMENNKEMIILTKLDFLFKFIDEDRVVELFNELKIQLSKTHEQFSELLKLYNSIITNESSLELLEKKTNELNDIISKIQEFNNLYITTNNKDFLTAGLELYVNKIPDINNTILKLKYKHNFVEKVEEKNNEYYKLIQDKYNLNNLEIIIKPNK